MKTSGIASDKYVDMHAYTLKEPYAVVGLIFPWNGPIFNFCAKLAPALAAGCSMVVKPAEETPLSAILLDKLIAQAGVPEGVVNLITGMATRQARRSPRIRVWTRSIHRIDQGARSSSGRPRGTSRR